jgi:putative hemolysin
MMEELVMTKVRNAALLMAILSGLAMEGCAERRDDANIYGSLVGQRVVGNEMYVTVTNVWNEIDALPLAERHCAKYGKAARYVPREPGKAVFNCVPKSSN